MTTNDTDKQLDPLHGPNLILDVENFGPIAEAKNIEFKPMTVFVGPSNTGKTYLATLMHAALRANPSFDQEPSMFFNPTHPDDSIYDDDRYWSLVDELASLVEFVIKDPENRGASVSADLCVKDLDGRLQEFMREITHLYLTNFSRAASQSVADYFDVIDFSSLTNRSITNQGKLQAVLRDNAGRVHISLVDPIVKDFKHQDTIGVFYDTRKETIEADKAVQAYIESGSADLEIEMFAMSSLNHLPRSHYFRAGRTGLLDAYRELASLLIQRASDRSRRNQTGQRPTVSLSTNEFLRNLVVLRPNSDTRFRSAQIGHLASVLENSILLGKVNIKDVAGLTYFEFEKDGVSIPLDRASSMVTEIAPVILLIRGLVQDGDLLTIDEPEAHLHPEAQQQMAAALAFMVRSGLRVLITTHSHYMVEQLGNFVAVSTLEPDLRKRVLKLGGALGEEDIFLDESEVAVYDFATDKAEHGSVVETVEFNQDYGYFPRDHNWAIADQMNRTQRVIEARIDQDDPVAK